MSSKILQLTFGARDLSQAEKKILLFEAEQILKMKYRRCAIITCGLYIFTPFLSSKKVNTVKLDFKELLIKAQIDFKELFTD